MVLEAPVADRLISVLEDDASVRSAIVDLLVTRFRMRTLRSETNIYAVPYGPRDCPRRACAR